MNQYRSNIRALYRRCEMAIFILENDDLVTTKFAANELVESLEKLVEEVDDSGKVPEAYLSKEIKAKIPHWEKNKKKLNSTKLDKGEISNILSWLAESIRILQQNLEEHDNFKWPIFSKLSKKKIRQTKKLAVFFAILMLIVFLKNQFIAPRGLTGFYYKGTDFDELIMKRVDRKINFHWGRKSPSRKIKDDFFSIRWKGWLFADRPGKYDLITMSDDGVRLHINSKLVIDNWVRQNVKTERVIVPLKKGKNKIQLDYFERKKWAVIKLLWKPPEVKQERIIPTKYLLPYKEEDLSEANAGT